VISFLCTRLSLKPIDEKRGETCTFVCVCKREGGRERERIKRVNTKGWRQFGMRSFFNKNPIFIHKKLR